MSWQQRQQVIQGLARGLGRLDAATIEQLHAWWLKTHHLEASAMLGVALSEALFASHRAHLHLCEAHPLCQEPGSSASSIEGAGAAGPERGEAAENTKPAVPGHDEPSGSEAQSKREDVNLGKIPSATMAEGPREVPTS